MASTLIFENPEFAKLPATAAGARALGLTYYYTGRPCKHSHFSLRYTTSGNCVLCMVEKQGRLSVGLTNARSQVNYEKAVKAAEAGLSTYVPEYPCHEGHSLRYTGSGNCVECSKASVAKKTSRGYQRWRRIEKEYGLTKGLFEELKERQVNCCAICARLFTDDSKIHIDHCHKTNKVRGLLCGPCNQALGLFQETTAILKKAQDYLDCYKSN